MSPDLAARRTIIAAYLYYERASPIISDEIFDKMCVYVCNNWGLLEPIRQWQLGSPEELRSSGFHIRITQQGECAAVAAHRDMKKCEPHGDPIAANRWRVHPEFGCFWAGLGG